MMWVYQTISNLLSRVTLVAWALLGLVLAYTYEHGIERMVVHFVSAVLGRDETFFRALVAIAIVILVLRYAFALLAVDYAAERRVREAVDDDAHGRAPKPHGDAFRAANAPLHAPLLCEIVAELKLMFPRAQPTPDTRAAAEVEVRRILKKLRETTKKDLRLRHAAALGRFAVALLFIPTDDEIEAEQMIASYTAQFRRDRVRGVAPDFLELLIRTWLSTQSRVVTSLPHLTSSMEQAMRFARTIRVRVGTVFGRSDNGAGASQHGASRDSSELTPLLGSESTAPV